MYRIVILLIFNLQVVTLVGLWSHIWGGVRQLHSHIFTMTRRAFGVPEMVLAHLRELCGTGCYYCNLEGAGLATITISFMSGWTAAGRGWLESIAALLLSEATTAPGEESRILLVKGWAAFCKPSGNAKGSTEPTGQREDGLEAKYWRDWKGPAPKRWVASLIICRRCCGMKRVNNYCIILKRQQH